MYDTLDHGVVPTVQKPDTTTGLSIRHARETLTRFVAAGRR
jgi:hypothetical protein